MQFMQNLQVIETVFIPGLVNLQLFAEGGAGDGGTAGTGTSGANAADAAQHKGDFLGDVKYGIDIDTGEQVSDAGKQQTQSREEAFEQLIKGEYKDIYDARMEKTIKSRLKGSKETVDAYQKAAPILELLAKKHGVDVKDLDGLSKAIEEDDSYFEEEALKRGLSVKQYKEVRKMEKENAELKAYMEEQKSKANTDRIYAALTKQADETKQIYPSFNIKAELQNPQFTDLLKANIDVKTAYEVLHKDEIIPAAMQFAAREVETKVVNNIMAGGRRPAENGNSNQASALHKSDVSQLNSADINEINRRVARGEKITFGNTPMR